MPTDNADFYYNATAYLGIKQNDTISLSWLGPNCSNSTNRTEVSKEIRQACFRTFVSKDTTEQNAQKYNLNDIRFWTSAEWKRIEEGKIKKREFEKEKIKHPENIYEPPKRFKSINLRFTKKENAANYHVTLWPTKFVSNSYKFYYPYDIGLTRTENIFLVSGSFLSS